MGQARQPDGEEDEEKPRRLVRLASASHKKREYRLDLLLSSWYFWSMSKTLEERVAELERVVAELKDAQRPIVVGDRVVCVSTNGVLTQDWDARPGDMFTVEYVDPADMTFKEGSKWYNLGDFQRVRS